MSKRKRVPEDLMASILSEGSATSDGGREPSGPRGAEATLSGATWEEQPERIGVTFNLSKGLSAELDQLRQELRTGQDTYPSRSEIAEAALRIAVEDLRERGGESELARRLSEHPVTRAETVPGGTTRRSVDEAGFVVETIYDDDGGIVDENVVGAVADLPVEDEYVDEAGRLVSLARDELGNTFEQILDANLNTLATRLLSGAD